MHSLGEDDIDEMTTVDQSRLVEDIVILGHESCWVIGRRRVGVCATLVDLQELFGDVATQRTANQHSLHQTIE